MRSVASLSSLMVIEAAAIFLLAFVALPPDPLRAEPGAAAAPAPDQGATACPEPQQREAPKLWHIPRFAGLKPALEPSDEIAALEAIHYALSEVADGSSYVWHRRNGHLNGIVRPQMSFRDASGAVCRQITVALTAGEVTRRVEGVACREADKSWLLKG